MPMPIQRRARHPLAQERPGEKPGGQRLKAGHQGRDPGRQPVLHRPEHATEIEPVQENAGDQAVAPIVPVAGQDTRDRPMTARTRVAST